MKYNDLQSMRALVQQIDEDRKNLIKDPDFYSRILRLELMGQKMKLNKCMPECFPDEQDVQFAKRTYQGIKASAREILKEIPECDHEMVEGVRKALRIMMALRYTMGKQESLRGHLLEAGEPERIKAVTFIIPAGLLTAAGTILTFLGQVAYGILAMTPGTVIGILGLLSLKKSRDIKAAAERALASEARRLQDELVKLGVRRQSYAEVTLKEVEAKVNGFAAAHPGFRQALRDFRA